MNWLRLLWYLFNQDVPRTPKSRKALLLPSRALTAVHTSVCIFNHCRVCKLGEKTTFTGILLDIFVHISLHLVSVDSLPTEETTKGGVVASRQLADKYWTQRRWPTSCGEFPEVGNVLAACLCVSSSTSPGSGSGP